MRSLQLYLFVCLGLCIYSTETVQHDSSASDVESSFESITSRVSSSSYVTIGMNSTETLNIQPTLSSNSSIHTTLSSSISVDLDISSSVYETAYTSFSMASTLSSSESFTTIETNDSSIETSSVGIGSSSLDMLSESITTASSTTATTDVLSDSNSVFDTSYQMHLSTSTSVERATKTLSDVVTISSDMAFSTTNNVSTNPLLSSMDSSAFSSYSTSDVTLISIVETAIPDTAIESSSLHNTSTISSSQPINPTSTLTLLSSFNENQTSEAVTPLVEGSFSPVSTTTSSLLVTSESLHVFYTDTLVSVTTNTSTVTESNQESFEANSVNQTVNFSETVSVVSTIPTLQSTQISYSELTSTLNRAQPESTIAFDETIGYSPTRMSIDTSSVVREEISSTTEHGSIGIAQTLPPSSGTFSVSEGIQSTSSVKPTPHSAYIEVTPSHFIPVEGTGKTYRILLTFEGLCGRIEDSDQLEIEFLKALVDIIRDFIPDLTEDDFELTQLLCNPFKVVLLIRNIRDTECLSMLTLSVRNLTMNVPIIDSSIINYHATGIQLYPVGNRTSDGMDVPTTSGLATSDIVVIVISALLFAFLIFLGGIVFCRECYKRKRAASFNLLDVPHVNLKLDDFTLTRIPRPKMTYFENRAKPIVTNGRTRQTSKESHVSVKDEGMRVKASPENIHVRMRDHSDGIIIGVTCSPITSETNSPTSSHGPCMDQSGQSLLKGDHSEGGTTNPTCDVDDEVNVSLIHEDGEEEFL